jgi:hypothetical protein
MKKTRFLIVLSTILMASGLSGCFFHPSPPTPEEQAQEIDRLISKGGYIPKHNHTFESFNETWQHEGKSIEVSLLVPNEPGHYPLIIYLPGLGEHARCGGQRWREGWVKAGFAVFSVQPHDIGEALKEIDDEEASRNKEKSSGLFGKDKDEKQRNSKAAMKAELNYLGYEFFSQDALAKHAEDVLWAYKQFVQRAKAGISPFASADVTKVMITGYDIGAETVAGLIGERFDAPLPADQTFKPLGAILLSPSVNIAEGHLTSRFKDIYVPLLTVTGSEDEDPYGISSSPRVRTAIWEYVPPGDKYLLLLKNGRHDLLAGSILSRSPVEDFEKQGESEGDWEDSTPFFSNSFGGGRKGGRSGSGFRRAPGGFERRSGQIGDREYKQIAAVLSISISFLEASTGTDRFAHAWLKEMANLWLGDVGAFKAK